MFQPFQCDSQCVELLFCFGFRKPRKASRPSSLCEADFPVMTKLFWLGHPTSSSLDLGVAVCKCVCARGVYFSAQRTQFTLQLSVSLWVNTLVELPVISIHPTGFYIKLSSSQLLGSSARKINNWSIFRYASTPQVAQIMSSGLRKRKAGSCYFIAFSTAHATASAHFLKLVEKGDVSQCFI